MLLCPVSNFYFTVIKVTQRYLVVIMHCSYAIAAGVSKNELALNVLTGDVASKAMWSEDRIAMSKKLLSSRGHSLRI